MAIPAPARDRFCVWGLCLATRRKVVCDEIGYVLKLFILRTSIHESFFGPYICHTNLVYTVHVHESPG